MNAWLDGGSEGTHACISESCVITKSGVSEPPSAVALFVLKLFCHGWCLHLECGSSQCGSQCLDESDQQLQQFLFLAGVLP